MGKCWFEQPEFGLLKVEPHNEPEAQWTLCKRTFTLGALGVKALVSPQKTKKHQLASESLSEVTLSHTSVRLRHRFPVQGYYIKLN